MKPDVDVAILGGGCAGLSLATRLAGSALSTMVIEPRGSYSDDRTWSFWRTAPDPFEDCVRARWSRWTVDGPDGLTQRGSGRLWYETVSAGAFYQRAGDIIDGARNLELRLSCAAQGASRQGAGWRIETDAGALYAANLIDTRPSGRKPRYGQFFLGQEIRTTRPVFTPDIVPLMHFRPARSGGVDFLYILPFAADHALVEVTSFAPVPPDTAVFQTWLHEEIEALDAGTVEVLRTERGALPMQVGYGAPTPDGPVRLGLSGGAARPSTGYAFARIQKQAERAAADLRAGQTPRVMLDSPMTRFMDRVFLQVLRSRPERGPALFQALFHRVPADRLEMFLSGSTATRDRLAVMTALPTLPFMQAAVWPS
ncbi:lycopene cyclase [Rhodobacteraceae bacterium W635]|uniref:lycopene cyclase family protein n=1 Tax=Nioella halotolerans TaxID=2303578 RepID=UPI000E3DF133|nr:lycopene cyclase [Rhodobacteraceae bacterium W635]